MKKIFPIIALFLFFSLPSVNAAERNPFVEATQAARVTLMPGAVEGVKKVRAELKEKVAAKLAEIMTTQQKRGWEGVVKKIDKSSLVLVCRQKEEREILLDPEAAVLDSHHRRFSLNRLKAGQRLLVMGYLKGEKTLLAKRIIVLANPKPRQIFSSFGVIADRSRTEKVFSLIPVQHRNEVQEFIVNAKTMIWLMRADKAQEGSYKDLTIRSRAVIIYRQEKNSRQALKILLVKPAVVSPSPTNAAHKK